MSDRWNQVNITRRPLKCTTLTTVRTCLSSESWDTTRAIDSTDLWCLSDLVRIDYLVVGKIVPAFPVCRLAPPSFASVRAA